MAIASAANNPDHAQKVLNKYYEEMFPWAKDERVRRERIKTMILRHEGEKRYIVKPLFAKAEFKKLAEQHALKQSGFK